MTKALDHTLAPILGVGLAVRLLFAYLAWTPVAQKTPDETMSVMYQRSAYLLAVGHGYSQALPGSQAHRDLQGTGGIKERIRGGEKLTPALKAAVSQEGLYPEMLHPPGWSWIAATLHRALGIPIWLIMQGMGILIDLVGCGLLFFLVLQSLGQFTVARASAWLYALFPPLAASSVELVPTVFATVGVLLATFLFVKGLKNSSRTRAITLLILASMVSGLIGYFRPDYLLIAPFLCLSFWWVKRSFTKMVGFGLLSLALCVVTLLPWGIRNHSITGRWIFTSSSAGATLLTGLGTYPNPWGFGPSDVDRAREASEHGIGSPWSPEADTLFRSMFTEAVRSDPAAFAKIIVRRLWMPLATPHSWGINSGLRTKSFTEIRRGGSVISSIPYLVVAFWPRVLSAILSFLGLAGFVWLLVRESQLRDYALLLALVPLYAALTHILTHMAPYYLIPGVFVNLVGLSYLAERVWRRDWRLRGNDGGRHRATPRLS